ERIKSGVCQAVIVNSGNANCCTGDQGMQHARSMADHAAEELGISQDLVLVASTGVIGQPLPIDSIRNAIPDLVHACDSGKIDDFARAIMTTDTVPKVVSRNGKIKGKPYTITGVAKGAGMIRPDMATMLCFVCSDAGAAPDVLKEMLVEATDQSFNRITIDGDTSTNDTVLLLANGLSGASIDGIEDQQSFQAVLNDLLLELAKMMVRDGEGATKCVEILVRGASSDSDARTVADTVAHSTLVKTALFGEDANWGRIIAAAGRAGVPMDPDQIDIFFGDVQMVNKGLGCGKAIEAEATRVLKTPEFTLLMDLNMGSGTSSVFTCDLSIDYVKINADYRT
ncbi:MAG: bifunctional glutamate N-acetyltransferase/amino-acid acetyltransferase ArgJ, partial [Desulfobacterales bacterium]